jgi:hypothetical protein
MLSSLLTSIRQRPFKNAIVRAFTSWMSRQISHLINLGESPDSLRVDTSLLTLKPLLVDWTWCSWIQLFDQPDLIKEGWKKAGLGEVLDTAKQLEAMRFCLNTEEPVLGEEPEDVDAGSDEDEGEEPVEAEDL